MAESLDHLFHGFRQNLPRRTPSSLEEHGKPQRFRPRYPRRKNSLRPRPSGELHRERGGELSASLLGIAAYFRIDGRDIPIPMAIEETSVVTCSGTAKWIRSHSGAEITAPLRPGE